MIEKGGLSHHSQDHYRIAAMRVYAKDRLDALNPDRRGPAEQRLHRLGAGDIDQLDVEIVLCEQNLYRLRTM